MRRAKNIRLSTQVLRVPPETHLTSTRKKERKNKINIVSGNVSSK